MLPLPAATTTLENTLTTSQPVFDAFKPYAYMEIGLLIGALVIVFIIAIFWSSIRRLFGHTTYDYHDSRFDIPSSKNFMQKNYKPSNNSWTNRMNEKMNRF